MAKSYEQLKESFTFLNEIQEELRKKWELKQEADERFKALKDELEQTKEQRKEMLEKKVMGQAKDSDLKKLDSKMQELEKGMAIVSEEYEIINRIQNESPYNESDINQEYKKWLSVYSENEFQALEDELRAAKEAYMAKFLEYFEANSKVEKLRGELVSYMRHFKMPQANYTFGHTSLINKDVLVNPKHLEDKGIRY